MHTLASAITICSLSREFTKEEEKRGREIEIAKNCKRNIIGRRGEMGMLYNVYDVVFRNRQNFGHFRVMHIILVLGGLQ